MSVINEALKKAGQSVMGEKGSGAQTPGSQFRPELLKAKGRINWGPFFVIAVLLLITTPILAPLFHGSFQNTAVYSNQPVPSTAEKIAGAVNRRSQFAVEETPIAAPAAPSVAAVAPAPRSFLPKLTPEFSLDGLVYSTGGSYCLINGKVLEVGGTVNGARLVSVTPTEAVLDYQGKSLVLSATA